MKNGETKTNEPGLGGFAGSGHDVPDAPDAGICGRGYTFGKWTGKDRR